MTIYELLGLIVFQEYEIAVAAYNAEGVGVYSQYIRVRTQEGVPSEPPTQVWCEEKIWVSTSYFGLGFLGPKIKKNLSAYNYSFKMILLQYKLETVNYDLYFNNLPWVYSSLLCSSYLIFLPIKFPLNLL